MMKLLKVLSIEVTRRCNEHCPHCMRGEPENINIPFAYIDKILSDEELIIYRLVFSGGEPTLNPEAIIYSIDKIIKERKKVLSIQITTNGLIYSEPLISALERFATYTTKTFSEVHKLMKIKKIVDIRLSNDQFHKELNHHKYKELNIPNIHVSYTGPIDILEDELLLTGRSKNHIFGTYFEYQLKPFNIRNQDGLIIIDNDIYLTSTGYITNQGDGEYQDMDNINFGSVEDFSFTALLNNYPIQIKNKVIKN